MGDRFQERGQRLFDGLTSGIDEQAVMVLAEEAARLADRLDDLNSIISGKGVLNLMHFRVPNVFDGADDLNHVTVEVKFDNVLGEARQQAGALRQILATLGIGKAESAAPEQKGTALDELNARRASRSTGTTGRSRA